MQCPHCHAENRAGARFCRRCGEALEVQQEQSQAPDALVCPACGSPLKAGARFCGHCGSVVTPAEPDNPPGSLEAGALEASPVVTPAAQTMREIVPQPLPSAPVSRIQDALPQGIMTSATSRPPSGAPLGSRPTRKPQWFIAAIAALAVGTLSLCLVLALAAGPAFGRVVPALPPIDLTRPDLTILVKEAYLSDMVGEALPEVVDGTAVLDVQPGNLIVVTVDFQLLIIRLQVVVNSRIAVEEGRIRVSLESIETGGHDLLDLVGMDQLELGEDITGTIQDVLEDELGEGARLLAISTDDDQVTLTARWD